jgi:hypothetical protein
MSRAHDRLTTSFSHLCLRRAAVAAMRLERGFGEGEIEEFRRVGIKFVIRI